MSQDETFQPAAPDGNPTLAVPGIACAGKVIDGFRLQQKLGDGGMGEVWLAEQLSPVRRQVALKVIKPGMDTAQVVARFNAERQALAVMEHPNVARIFHGGSTAEGRPYFAMEYVKGEPITQYCDRNQLTLVERLRLFIDLCDGVQHAHQKGIIHRDLKPSNVLVTVQGERAIPRIIDFGIAKAIAQPLTGHSLFTEIGVLIGTPEYMSPEQAEATSLDVDTRSDVYSLGVILHELLTGVLPFDNRALRAAGMDELRRTIREKDPLRPSTRVRDLGKSSEEIARKRDTDPPKLARALRGDLDWIVLKALEKDRTRRYDSAVSFANDVRHYLAHEPVRATPPSLTYRMRKFVRRHRVGVAVAAALVVMLVSISALSIVQAQRTARERDRADREAAAARQVANFLAGLFTSSDPNEARGNKLTAQEILAKGAQDVQEKLADQPEMRARLQSTIGDVYTNLGMYTDAEPLLSEALATQRRILGPDDPERTITTNRMANLKWYLSKLSEAEALYVEVLERHRRVLGENHPDSLKANFDLASVYGLQKRYAEAEQLTRNTLEQQRRVLGSEHPATIDSLSNLQGLYFRQGRYAEAEPLAVETLTSMRRQLGEGHPLAILAEHNLAAIYSQLGRYDRAEPLFLKSLAGYRRVLGDGHPQTCRSLSKLAEMYQRQRRYVEAEPLLLASYEGYARTFGGSDASAGAVASQIASLYSEWGKQKQAAEWKAKISHE